MIFTSPLPSVTLPESPLTPFVLAGARLRQEEQLTRANRAFLEWTGYADLAAASNSAG